MQSHKKINSDQKSSYKMVLTFGVIFLLVSFPFFIPSVFAEMEIEGSAVFMFLLFPLIGVGALFFGWSMRKKYLYFGLTPLVPLPEIGQVGGQVGGRIELEKYFEKNDLSATLNCVNQYSTRRRNDNSRTEHHRVLWREQMAPLYRKSSTGSLIEFCFDVPAGEYTKDTYKGRGSVYWEVCVEGLMNGVKFKRSWKVPVEEGNQLSSIVITDRHKDVSARAMDEKAEVSVEEQIETKKNFNGLDLVSDQGRNKSTSSIFLLMGAVFSIVGFVSFDKQEFGLALIGIVFSIVGYMILCYGIFLSGRKLECKISGTTVRTRRSFFGFFVSTKEGKLTSAEQLSLEVTMSSTVNGKLTETMAIYAKVESPVSKKLKLVEGIVGRKAGEAMMKKIVKAMSGKNRFH